MRDREIAEDIGPLLVVLVAGGVTASADLSSLLALDVQRVLSGELWRLFSGHLAHLTWRHYAVDAFAYWLLFYAYAGRRSAAAANALVIVAAVGVSVTVVTLRLHPIYGGLSGLSCGACAALISAMVLDKPNSVCGYALALLFCVYLLLAQDLVAGISVASEAHWAGALSGTVTEGVRFYWTSKFRPKAKLRARVPAPGSLS